VSEDEMPSVSQPASERHQHQHQQPSVAIDS